MELNRYLEWTNLVFLILAWLGCIYFFPVRVVKTRKCSFNTWSPHDAYVVIIILCFGLDSLVLMIDTIYILVYLYHPFDVIPIWTPHCLMTPILKYTAFLYGGALATVPFLSTYKYRKFAGDSLTVKQSKYLDIMLYVVLPLLNLIPTVTIMLTDTIPYDVHYPYLRFIILTVVNTINTGYCSSLETKMLKRVLTFYQQESHGPMATFVNGEPESKKQFSKARRAKQVQTRIQNITRASALIALALVVCSILSEFFFRQFMTPIYKIIMSLAIFNGFGTVSLSKILYDGLVEINETQNNYATRETTDCTSSATPSEIHSSHKTTKILISQMNQV